MKSKKKAKKGRSISLFAHRKERKRKEKRNAMIASGIGLGVVFLIIIFCLIMGKNEEERSAPTTAPTSTPTTTSEVHIETTREPETQSATTTMSETTTVNIMMSAPEFNVSEIAEYSGTPFVEVNDNTPFFVEDEYSTTADEYYSPLDTLGRSGYACACIGVELMPTEPRGEIGDIKPSGWHTVRYDDLITDRYLYNRCHLIGYQLSGENDNPLNLITGTRYMNIEGMLPFENKVCDYILSTNNHVLYRATPIYENDNLVATGVLLEAFSVEDQGKGICFSVFTYNVQPGIVIDYATGESDYAPAQIENTTVAPERTITEEATEPEPEVTYILNKNSKKFHYPYCSSVYDMKESNKIYSYDTRDEIISAGYTPCKRCNP